MVQINARKVRRIYHGEKKVYEDNSTEWLQCKTFDGSGNVHTGRDSEVYMHDNEDGTALIVGNVYMPHVLSGNNYKVIEAPEGYSFTGDITNTVAIMRGDPSHTHANVSAGAIVVTMGGSSSGSGEAVLYLGMPDIYANNGVAASVSTSIVNIIKK